LTALRSHAAFALLFALAAPALFHFAHSGVVASLGDDSISYLLLARYMLDANDPLVRPWVGYHAHFPVLFPAVLALTGGVSNLAIAHGAVAAFAAACVFLVYRYAATLLAGAAAALWVTALFLLAPTAWISISGILSESMFLFVTLCALLYYEKRIGDLEPDARSGPIFGVLLGAALLVRSVGAALLLAYALHIAIASRGQASRLRMRLLPLLPAAVMVAAWLAWRPTPEGYNYATVTSHIFHMMFLPDPLGYLGSCAEVLFGGWVRSFTADSAVHWLPTLAFGVLGAMGLAGALLRARDNRLDGWYVLVSLGVVFLWLFSEDNARRLLYPVVPIMLMHAVLFARYMAQGMAQGTRRALLRAVAALPALLCLPAWWLVQSKSLDRETIYPGLRYRYADMTEYYTNVNLRVARDLAAKHAATLGGLESLGKVTPPGATSLWVRPEYVAILGGRPALPLLGAAQERGFVRELRRSNAEFLVVSTLLKAPMDGRAMPAQKTFNWALAIGTPVFSLPSRSEDGLEVAIFRLDRAAMDAKLQAPR
jgi:hypothetical protein